MAIRSLIKSLISMLAKVFGGYYRILQFFYLSIIDLLWEPP